MGKNVKNFCPSGQKSARKTDFFEKFLKISARAGKNLPGNEISAHAREAL